MPAGLERAGARWFFALWPDATVRTALWGLVDTLKGGISAKWVKPENLHMTLVFLGEVSPSKYSPIADAALELEPPVFMLQLNRLEFWSGGIVCVSASQPPVELAILAQGLSERLSLEGFPPDPRPYRNHVTLARKGPVQRPAVELAEPIAWRVGAFRLIESRPGAGGSDYAVRRVFPFRET
jgi:2'-5' RNA ligase